MLLRPLMLFACVPQGFSLAVKLGLTKQQVDSLVGIHPTAAEEVVGLKGPDRVVGQPQ
jgi:glutathione reductase (NADPH)